MWAAVNLPPWMKRWVALTRVIANLLFTYPQVHEYVSFHFCARRLKICLSNASASTLIRPPAVETRGVKCQSLLRKTWRYFLFFSRSVVSRQVSEVLDY